MLCPRAGGDANEMGRGHHSSSSMATLVPVQTFPLAWAQDASMLFSQSSKDLVCSTDSLVMFSAPLPVLVLGLCWEP